MGTVQSSIRITDAMTGPLRNMDNALRTVINSFETMQNKSARSVDTSAIANARAELAKAEDGLSRIKERVEDVDGVTQKAKTSSGSLLKTLMGFSAVQKVIGLVTDSIDGAISRTDTMTNFQRKMSVMTGSSDTAKAALEQLKATTKGTAYGLDVAAAAAQNFVTRGASIGTATAQVEKWGDAVAFYGNGTNEQFSNVTDALGKMLSKGKVEMDQLDRLTDAGINAVGIYAQATGTSAAAVQKSLSKGEISSQQFIDTVSTAFSEGTNGVLNVTGAAKEAGGTWATSIENMRAAVKRGVISMIENVNNALSAAGFGTILTGIQSFGALMENMLGGLGARIGIILNMFSPLLRMVRAIGNFAVNNWSVIEPIIMGIVTALGLYKGALLAVSAASAVSAAIKTVGTVVAVAHGAAITGEMLATTGMTKAQLSFNAALYACPIVWIIAAVIALVVAVIAITKAVKKARGESISALGAVMGAVFVAGAAIWNAFAGLVNGIIQLVWTKFAYPAIGIVEWVLNVTNGGFNSFGDAVKNLIGNIIGWFMSLGQVVTKIIDAIFGSNWTGKLEELKGNVLSWGKNENAITLSREAPTVLKRIEYGTAYNKGASMGDSWAKKAGGLFQAGNDKWSDLMGNALEDTGLVADMNDITGNTAALKDQVSGLGADVSALRSLAEREAINQFTTASVQVDMHNVNHLSSDMDIDGMVNQLAKLTGDALAITAEGVHV